jgi:hypothetical protein
MNLINNQLQFYIDKLENNEPFSIGMYGDGEWQCIFNEFGNRFKQNCEGTMYSKELTEQMINSLRFRDKNFYFATDDFAKSKMDDYNKMIDMVLKKLDAHIDFVDKHVWHKEMCEGNLNGFIKALLKKNVCVVSNKMLRGLTFLKYDKFIEVDYPNCFGDLDRAVEECLNYGKEGVYIFACGIPATLFVQALHGTIPNSWFLDLGSIWDSFVGIGGQRPTRREWYKHPETWKEWRDKTLEGIEWEVKELPMVEWYGMGSKEI